MKKNVGEDARKLGVNSITAGLVGYIINSDKVSALQATIIAIIGVLLWACGIILSKEGAES